MDSFFRKTVCDRCGKSLSKGRSMSIFNLDCICPECKAAEHEHPRYEEAVQAEREAIRNGSYHFDGIGL